MSFTTNSYPAPGGLTPDQDDRLQQTLNSAASAQYLAGQVSYKITYQTATSNQAASILSNTATLGTQLTALQSSLASLQLSSPAGTVIVLSASSPLPAGYSEIAATPPAAATVGPSGTACYTPSAAALTAAGFSFSTANSSIVASQAKQCGPTSIVAARGSSTSASLATYDYATGILDTAYPPNPAGVMVGGHLHVAVASNGYYTAGFANNPNGAQYTPTTVPVHFCPSAVGSRVYTTVAANINRLPGIFEVMGEGANESLVCIGGYATVSGVVQNTTAHTLARLLNTALIINKATGAQTTITTGIPQMATCFYKKVSPYVLVGFAQIGQAANWPGGTTLTEDRLYYFRITFNTTLTASTLEQWHTPILDSTVYARPFHFYATDSGMYAYRALAPAISPSDPRIHTCQQIYVPFSAPQGELAAANQVTTIIGLPVLMARDGSGASRLSAGLNYAAMGVTGQPVSAAISTVGTQSIASITCFDTPTTTFARTCYPLGDASAVGYWNSSCLIGIPAPASAVGYTHTPSTGLTALRLAIKL